MNSRKNIAEYRIYVSKVHEGLGILKHQLDKKGRSRDKEIGKKVFEDIWSEEKHWHTFIIP